jgi:hypothetical protein
MKGSTGASRLAAANASEATLAAQKKENLYGDLTGLIVRSVKREGGEDVFDCIQTGRNGSMFTFLPTTTKLPFPSPLPTPAPASPPNKQ